MGNPFVNEEGQGSYSGPSFMKRPLRLIPKRELVRPYLHYLDQRVLTRVIDAKLYIEETYARFNKGIVASGFHPDSSFNAECVKTYQELPESFIFDVYNSYYNRAQDLKFAPRTMFNIARFKLLEKANDPFVKVITQRKSFQSALFTEYRVAYVVVMLTMLKTFNKPMFEDMIMDMYKTTELSDQDKQDPTNELEPTKDWSDHTKDDLTSRNADAMQKVDDDANGEPPADGEFDEKTIEDIIEGMTNLTSRDCQAISDMADDLAKESTKAAEAMFDGSELAKIWEEPTEAAKMVVLMNKEEQNRMVKELQKIKMNEAAFKKAIKSIMDKTLAYFSPKQESYYENVFDAGTMDGFEDFERLDPRIRKIFAADLEVKSHRKVGKIHAYVDVSSSMSSGSGMPGVSKETFMKALLIRVKNMDLLQDLYSFNTEVKQHKSRMFDILALKSSGNTDIDEVVDSIITNGENALVLTDGESRVSKYSKLVFFVGVKGANFGHFGKDILQQYVEHQQIVYFDGDEVWPVDINGKPIKKG